MRHCLENFIYEFKVRPNVDISALVFGGVAVLGSGKDGDAASVVFNLVALHADFVRTDDCLETVILAEALGNVWTELQTDTSLARPTSWLWLWVSPEHLHHQTLLTWLPLVVSVQLANIIQGDLVV